MNYLEDVKQITKIIFELCCMTIYVSTSLLVAVIAVKACSVVLHL